MRTFRTYATGRTYPLSAPNRALKPQNPQVSPPPVKNSASHVLSREAEPYPLDVVIRPGLAADNRETWRVEKMKWKSKTDHSSIVYNSAVAIEGIPDVAHAYLLGSRTGLEWLIDRYQVRTDKASGIVNDPNDWCDELGDPTYIVELIRKVTTVSVKTVELVAQLSS